MMRGHRESSGWCSPERRTGFTFSPGWKRRNNNTAGAQQFGNIRLRSSPA